MTQNTIHSQMADRCAGTIIKAFDAYRTEFKMITKRARERFENRDWHGLKADSNKRLDLYKTAVDQVVIYIKDILGSRVNDKKIWAFTKTIYSKMSGELDEWELAETFFNSATRRIFATVGVDPKIEFVDTCSRLKPFYARKHLYHTYAGDRAVPLLLEAILGAYEHQVPYEDAQRDARRAAEKIDSRLRHRGKLLHVERIEMLTAVFYRGKGAFLIGRIVMGSDYCPLVLVLLNTGKGIVLDAVLTTENEASILFSFTRSYFHVNVNRPFELVDFLKSIMPRKRIAELYISIGYSKHGKSELYCDLLQHLSRSNKKFEPAEGEKGMVMEVFAMPDYDLVFKAIKDHFPYPKNTTREAVMEKYDLVFKHDRAGRLVDAQEFEHLKFDRNRFSEDLIASLKRYANHSAVINDDHVIVKHVYIERRVIPLNIYLQTSDKARTEAAVVDYGNAIKDLAASNIFPGDILLKNFGVTRHGRVVFYDYDELCLLSACNFRVMPQPRSYAEEMSDEPWYGVDRKDVFPEELRNFIGLQGNLRDIFLRHHKDLFDVAFWHHIQSRINAGTIIDIFPYGQDNRLVNRKPQT